MGIFDDVSAQMKDAMKAKEEVRLAALRSIRAAFLNECKKNNATTLTDDVSVGSSSASSRSSARRASKPSPTRVTPIGPMRSAPSWP